MEHGKLTQNRSSLLQSAASKLRPDVFAHPVWVRFGKKGNFDSLIAADDLLNTAKLLQENDPSAACQILLLCAVYQNNTVQPVHALKTIQLAVTLSQRNQLAKETLWALWGLCAISTQQGNYEQASASLLDLQATLSEQNEWVLADFIDIFRQFLLQTTASSTALQYPSVHDQPFGDTLVLTFEWLHHWGVPMENDDPEFGAYSGHPTSQPITNTAWMQFFVSYRRWRGRWRDLMLAIRGDLKLQWTVYNSKQPNDQLSSWSPTQGMLPCTDPNSSLPPIQEDLQTQEPDVFSPAQEIIHPESTLPNGKLDSFIEVSDQNNHDVVERKVLVTPIAVHLLGMFGLSIGDTTVKIPASRGLDLLKYLLLHHKQYTPREVLMDVFWPDVDPELARNNLNVSMHSIRRALRNVTDLPVVVFEDGAYGLAPQLQVWLDVEEFEKCLKNGQRLEARNQLSAAIEEYESAISLYQGELLEQNPYDEWTVLNRERLRIAYLDTLDRLSQIYFKEELYSACRTACQLILIKDPCREDAHYLLMRCYSRQRQPHLALYQYQVCVESLRSELQVEPAPETTLLYNRIRRREEV